MQNLKDLLRLSLVPQIGAIRIQTILANIPLHELVTYDRQQLQQIGWKEEQIQAWLHPKHALIEQALIWQEQKDHHIITIFDRTYPYLLKQIISAPVVLYIKGKIELLNTPQIAIVGSRQCSHYGEHYANYFAGELARQGLTITSGLARGIDGICHQAALEAHGNTIAVLGSGLNHLYPIRHQKLAEQIVAQGGSLVSELLPDTPPIADNFPRRNRIISGLSLATLVIEANQKSGSLITARYALEQDREIFALPGAIHNEFSRGCHALIKQGAWLVESPQDILELLHTETHFFTYNNDLSTDKANAEANPLTTKVNIPPQYTALFQHIQSITPLPPDQLADKLHCSIDEILIGLLELEMLNVIKQVEGGYIRT